MIWCATLDGGGRSTGKVSRPLELSLWDELEHHSFSSILSPFLTTFSEMKPIVSWQRPWSEIEKLVLSGLWHDKMYSPEGLASEVWHESTEGEHSKEQKYPRRQNGWVQLFRWFFRVLTQAPHVVETKRCGHSRDCDDKKDPVDVGHVVHDWLLQLSHVVLPLVTQP